MPRVSTASSASVAEDAGPARHARSRILEGGFRDRDREHGEDKELLASVALTDGPMTRNGYDEARLLEGGIDDQPQEAISASKRLNCFRGAFQV